MLPLRQLGRRWPWRAPPWGGARPYAALADEAGRSAKAALRSLYKLVHPDLFHDHPAQKVCV
jgi:hypothetical protein